MLSAVLAGFLVAAAAPWLTARLGTRSGWALALLPLALTLYFASFLPRVAAGEALLFQYDWVPGLAIRLGFLLDGLSLLFALLISGIGTLIVIYAGGYLAGQRDLGRFYLFLLSFMASMLGLVLADNLITLFVFWELTSITSFLLIGFNHEDKTARASALQGLFVTVGGGLALLAGFVLLAQAGGSYDLSTLLTQGEAVRGDALYLPLLLLLLIGAFTKSAQAPFHFWLPNAMAAPTPVSAYLHSATMVKAGVYLLARLQPVVGGTTEWLWLVSLTGALTLLVGGVLALRATGMKRVLAYSTVMALGTLTLLAGIGTPAAATALVTFLLAHSLYKGALFLCAGIIDHEAGVRELREMGGLRRALPWTATASIIAALSLAGVMPLFGFIAKETLFEAVLQMPGPGTLLTAATTIGAMFAVAVAGLVALRPWFGAPVATPRRPHEAAPALLLGPVLLAALGLLFGLWPGLAERGLLAAAASAVHGTEVVPALALWHGFNVPLLLSLTGLLLGALLYMQWARVQALLQRLPLERYGAERGYDLLMAVMVDFAAWQTRLLQSGYLRRYIFITLATLLLVSGYALATRYPVWPALDISDLRFNELVIALVIVLAGLAAVKARNRLAAVAALGAAGFGVALLYVIFSAPDVGITQVLVETLTVILLVLVLFRLPGYVNTSRGVIHLRDAMVGVAVGGLMTWLLLEARNVKLFPSIADYFIAQSVPGGHGHNIVNVILVDFRALDTLGEIFVLGLAAVGVYAMLKLRAEGKR